MRSSVWVTLSQHVCTTDTEPEPICLTDFTWGEGLLRGKGDEGETVFIPLTSIRYFHIKDEH